MDIRTLSFTEMARLHNDLERALDDQRRFRIAQDSDGIKWKVGEGMWTPGYGTDDNAGSLVSDEVLDRLREKLRDPSIIVDIHGNRFATDGVSRCECGCKYWNGDKCIDCGTTHHSGRHD